MAETAQRFVVYSADRNFARFAVFPAGLFLVVAAIVIPADNPIKFVAAVFGAHRRFGLVSLPAARIMRSL